MHFLSGQLLHFKYSSSVLPAKYKDMEGTGVKEIKTQGNLLMSVWPNSISFLNWAFCTCLWHLTVMDSDRLSLGTLAVIDQLLISPGDVSGSGKDSSLDCQWGADFSCSRSNWERPVWFYCLPKPFLRFTMEKFRLPLLGLLSIPVLISFWKGSRMGWLPFLVLGKWFS